MFTCKTVRINEMSDPRISGISLTATISHDIASSLLSFLFQFFHYSRKSLSCLYVILRPSWCYPLLPLPKLCHIPTFTPTQHSLNNLFFRFVSSNKICYYRNRWMAASKHKAAGQEESRIRRECEVEKIFYPNPYRTIFFWRRADLTPSPYLLLPLQFRWITVQVNNKSHEANLDKIVIIIASNTVQHDSYLYHCVLCKDRSKRFTFLFRPIPSILWSHLTITHIII